MDIYAFVFSPWFWLALVVLFSVIELCTFGLTTVWFALSALVMVFLSFLPIPFTGQLAIFLAVAILLLVFTRPVAVRKFMVGKVKTNVEALAGSHALVTRAIGEFETGEVKINGQIWSARVEDGGSLEAGTRCEVVSIEGAHAVVRPLAGGHADGSAGGSAEA
jgi:membrane protein implicated in regulation of membrane protease activity